MMDEQQQSEIFRLMMERKLPMDRRALAVTDPEENFPESLKSPPLKARKNATLDDFINMVSEIVAKTMNPYKVTFIPDEGAIIHDPTKKLENPVILYKVVSRVPKKELKARFNESMVEKMDSVTGRTRTAHNWSQRQNCIVQFDVLASDYTTANAVMNTFEDTVQTYAGYFKSNGVAELLFEKYFTDENLSTYRQNLSVRSIQYFVEIEKLYTVFDTNVDVIESENINTIISK